MVHFDSQRLEQVLSNLLSNAIKYGGGAPIELLVTRKGKTAEVTVRDCGPGISKSDHLRIFMRYERAISANEVSGLGLGLFISKQILQAHGGSILVESELQKGAAFILNLPLL
jgi:signal transduction histidine kinase